jgi:hypothetical protein
MSEREGKLREKLEFLILKKLYGVVIVVWKKTQKYIKKRKMITCAPRAYDKKFKIETIVLKVVHSTLFNF